MLGLVYSWLHPSLSQEIHVVFLKCCEMSEKSDPGVYFPFGAWGKDAAAFKGFVLWRIETAGRS